MRFRMFYLIIFQSRCIYVDDLSQLYLDNLPCFPTVSLIFSRSQVLCSTLPRVTSPVPQSCLMERATDRINIQRDARLSVELRIGKEDSTTKKPQTDQKKTSPKEISQDMLIPTTQTIEMPSRPKDLPAVRTTQGKHICCTSRQHTDCPAATTRPNQPQKADDCLLLEYQDHLMLLESLNQLTTQRTKKLR